MSIPSPMDNIRSALAPVFQFPTADWQINRAKGLDRVAKLQAMVSKSTPGGLHMEVKKGPRGKSGCSKMVHFNTGNIQRGLQSSAIQPSTNPMEGPNYELPKLTPLPKWASYRPLALPFAQIALERDGEQIISKITDANNALKRGKPDTAAAILGRPLSQEELAAGKIQRVDNKGHLITVQGAEKMNLTYNLADAYKIIGGIFDKGETMLNTKIAAIRDLDMPNKKTVLDALLKAKLALSKRRQHADYIYKNDPRNFPFLYESLIKQAGYGNELLPLNENPEELQPVQSDANPIQMVPREASLLPPEDLQAMGRAQLMIETAKQQTEEKYADPDQRPPTVMDPYLSEQLLANVNAGRATTEKNIKEAEALKKEEEMKDKLGRQTQAAQAEAESLRQRTQEMQQQLDEAKGQAGIPTPMVDNTPVVAPAPQPLFPTSPDIDELKSQVRSVRQQFADTQAQLKIVSRRNKLAQERAEKAAKLAEEKAAIKAREEVRVLKRKEKVQAGIKLAEEKRGDQEMSPFHATDSDIPMAPEPTFREVKKKEDKVLQHLQNWNPEEKKDFAMELNEKVLKKGRQKKKEPQEQKQMEKKPSAANEKKRSIPLLEQISAAHPDLKKRRIALREDDDADWGEGFRKTTKKKRGENHWRTLGGGTVGERWEDEGAENRALLPQLKILVGEYQAGNKGRGILNTLAGTARRLIETHILSLGEVQKMIGKELTQKLYGKVVAGVGYRKAGKGKGKGLFAQLGIPGFSKRV